MFAFSLLILILPVVVIIFAVSYAVKNKERGEEIVFRHLYQYLVLFATLMMVIGGGISIFMAAADLVSPPSYYQSYSDYKQFRLSDKIESTDKKTPTEEELRKDYEQIKKDEIYRQKQSAKNQIIKSLGFIVIPLPIFIYFNRMRKSGE